MTTETINLKKIEVIGITTDFNMCECCGKTDLTKTVSILDKDSGITLHFGVVCASKADKYDTLEAANIAKQEVSKAVRNFDNKVKSANIITFNTLRKMFGVVPFQGGYKVNCDQSIIDDCFKKALVHLQNVTPSIFRYEA